MEDLFGNEKMLALSWKQPFAELMLHGKVETRKWKTNYRGLVLICVSKQPYNEEEIINISGEYQYQRIRDIILPYFAQNIRVSYGNAIAVGRLVDCREMTLKDTNACFVQFWDSDLRYCHVYKDIKPIIPFKWKGSQGWKTVEQDIIDKIIYKNA